jgi:hypothetical protein
MLSLYTRFIASDVPTSFGNKGSCTIFGDSDDHNKFYVLPEAPTFHEFNEKTRSPAFNMSWYYGSGRKSGGICTFTVALPMPKVADEKVKKVLLAAVTQDATVRNRALILFEMAKAKAANDNSGAEQRRNSLGLSEEQAKKYYQQYQASGDELQFYPNNDKVDFVPVPYTSGTVSIKGFGAIQAFQDWKNDPSRKAEFSQDFQATPSHLNDNTAVVSFPLNDHEVNLFWQALGGYDPSKKSGSAGELPKLKSELSSSVIAVQYTVGFEAMLPKAQAIVKLEQSAVAQVLKENRSASAGWGQTRHWQAVVGKAIHKHSAGAIQLILPSSLSDEKGKKTIQETLSAWAEVQLANMVQEQLPNVTLNDLTNDPDGTAQRVEAIQNQTRTYDISKSIANAANPNGQLPRIDTLVDKDSLTRHFQLIDLNKSPYRDINFIVQPPSDSLFASLKIESLVLTQISYDDKALLGKESKKPVSSLIFDKQSKRAEFEGTFDVNGQGMVDYSYVVTYQDGARQFECRNRKLDTGVNGYFLSFDKSALGVLEVKFNSAGLPWGVLESVIVESKYEGEVLPPVRFEQSAVLSVVKPLGQRVAGNFQYKVRFHFKGNEQPLYFPSDATEWKGLRMEDGGAGSDGVALPNPFGVGSGVKVLKFELDGKAARALLKVQYTVPVAGGAEKSFSSTVELGEGQRAIAWPVPTSSGGQGRLKVELARVYDAEDEGRTVTKIEIPANATVILVGLKDIIGV